MKNTSCTSMSSASIIQSLRRVHACTFAVEHFIAITGLMGPRKSCVLAGLLMGFKQWHSGSALLAPTTLTPCSQVSCVGAKRGGILEGQLSELLRLRIQRFDGTSVVVRKRRTLYGIQRLAHSLVRGGSQIDSHNTTLLG